MFRHHQIPSRRSQNLPSRFRLIRFLAKFCFYFLGLDLASFFEHFGTQVLNDVKLIEDDISLWQKLLDDVGVGSIHVASHGNDLVLKTAVDKHLEDGLYGLLRFTLDRCEDLSGLVIDEDGSVLLSLVDGDLVNSNDLEVLSVHVVEQCLELLLVEAANGIPPEVVFRGDSRR